MKLILRIFYVYRVATIKNIIITIFDIPYLKYMSTFYPPPTLKTTQTNLLNLHSSDSKRNVWIQRTRHAAAPTAVCR